jgi:hypothetical protein
MARLLSMAISGDLFRQIGRGAAGPVSIVAAFDRHTAENLQLIQLF